MDTVKRNRLLLVEDDQGAADLVRVRMESAGFTVQTAASGAIALTEAGEHRPDLVILDVRLPDMSGYEVCHQLRRFYGVWELPILILTGMDKPVDQLRGFAHGADAYLMKPYDSDELVRTVNLLLAAHSGDSIQQLS